MFWVATRDQQAGDKRDRVVGFGAAYLRGAVWFLAMLFVDPDEQARGLGRELLIRTFPGGSAPDPEGPVVLGTATDSTQPISNGLYAQYGMVPRLPVFQLVGRPRRGILPGLPSGVTATRFEDMPLEGAVRDGRVQPNGAQHDGAQHDAGWLRAVNAIRPRGGEPADRLRLHVGCWSRRSDCGTGRRAVAGHCRPRPRRDPAARRQQPAGQRGFDGPLLGSLAGRVPDRRISGAPVLDAPIRRFRSLRPQLPGFDLNDPAHRVLPARRPDGSLAATWLSQPARGETREDAVRRPTSRRPIPTATSPCARSISWCRRAISSSSLARPAPASRR